MKLLKPLINQGNWLSNKDSVKTVAEIRPYMLKELCTLYRLSYKAMYSNLKPLQHLLGQKQGYYYSARQVEIIFEHLGIPYSIIENS